MNGEEPCARKTTSQGREENSFKDALQRECSCAGDMEFSTAVSILGYWEYARASEHGRDIASIS